MNLLRQEKRPMDVAEIAGSLGENEKSVSRALGRLASVHELRRAGAGKFVVARGR